LSRFVCFCSFLRWYFLIFILLLLLSYPLIIFFNLTPCHFLIYKIINVFQFHLLWYFNLSNPILILLIAIYFVDDHFHFFSQISSSLLFFLLNFILVLFVVFFSFASFFIDIFHQFYNSKLNLLRIELLDPKFYGLWVLEIRSNLKG
jgi:hypothetical protein